MWFIPKDDKDTRKTVESKSQKNLDQEKYFEKYAKIVGDKSGINAAAIAQSNKSYGMGNYLSYRR